MSPVRLVTSLVAAALLVVLAGCGGDSSVDSEESTGASSHPVAEGAPEALAGEQLPDAARAAPGAQPAGDESQAGDRPAAGRPGQDLPTGVPLDADDPQVQRALKELLNPPNNAKPQGGEGRKDGLQSILRQLVGDAKRGAPAPADEDPASPSQERSSESNGAGLQAILDQLK